jgi:HPr kinase/phosphorylase
MRSDKKTMSKFTILDLIDLEPEKPNALDLRCLCGRKGLSKEIYSTEINRPGMALTGFFEKFVGERIQLIGRGEFAYIETTPQEELMPKLIKLLEYNIPCFIICYDLEPPSYFQAAADEAGIPILATPLDSSTLAIRLLRALDDVFAPKQTIHGVFVEVEGMGVLIQGESGVGKSETALELLDRGHRLIADDAVMIKCLNGNQLWGHGTSKVMGHHMEIRGLGIIDIAQVYGLNALRERKPVEMIFQLEEWDSSKNYDRLGTSGETATLLGVSIPLITLPVKPGRNIPIIIEAAVLNERLKSQGVHAAKEFNKNLIQWIESENARNLWFDRFVNRRGSK